jgi:hypothetical protein
MRTKKYAGIILTAACAALMQACYEDLGNYDYHPINTVAIAGINETYTVQMFSRLQITPQLTFSLGEEHDAFEYKWYLMGGGQYPTVKQELSAEKNLDIEIAAPFTVSTESFKVLYRVTNLTTKVCYDYVFRVFVSDIMQSGYIIMSETANGWDIHQIAPFRDTLTLYTNLLDRYASAIPREGNPVDIVIQRDKLSPSSAQTPHIAIWILTDRATNRLHPTDYSYKPEYNIKTISSIPNTLLNGDLIADKIAAVSTQEASVQHYMYFDGNWYFYNYNNIAWYYLMPLNVATENGAPYRASPYICVGWEKESGVTPAHGAILYNEDNHRFEYHNATNLLSGASAFLKTSQITADGRWTLDDTYTLMYMDTRIAPHSSAASGYAIVKSTTGGLKYYLQQFAIAMPVETGVGDFPAEFNAIADNVRFYAYHSSLPYLYFATEDQLYRVHTTTMTMDDITAQAVPSGHKISRLKNTAIRNFPRQNLIAIATYDPNGAAGSNGRLAFYNVTDGTGNLTLAKHPSSPTGNGYQIDMEWTGFGKVINVDYKQP